MIVNLFELVVILMALLHSRFARLPFMVAGNILLFSGMKAFIEHNYEVTISPGYEIYYVSSAVYFIVMALMFLVVKNRFYALVGLVLIVQAAASAMMLMNDDLWQWHQFINEKIILVECILVWLSSVRVQDEIRHS